MHPSMARLYAAAADLSPPIRTQSGLAAALNVSPQVVNNWESASRGISQRGAATAQAALAISVDWILHGKPPRFVSPAASHPQRLDRNSLSGALHSVRRLAETMRLDFGHGTEEGAIVRVYEHLSSGQAQDEVIPVILAYIQENGGTYHAPIRSGPDGTSGRAHRGKVRKPAGETDV